MVVWLLSLVMAYMAYGFLVSCACVRCTLTLTLSIAHCALRIAHIASGFGFG